MANEASKPTPGPWYIYEVATSINVRAADGAVCRMSISPDSIRGKEGHANARLISAAPELLEMTKLLERTAAYEIKRALKNDDDEGANLLTITLNLARAAIAKAEREG